MLRWNFICILLFFNCFNNNNPEFREAGDGEKKEDLFILFAGCFVPRLKPSWNRLVGGAAIPFTEVQCIPL